MAKHLSHHGDRLARELSNLERTRRKVEHLFGESKLARRDVERVYEGLFMKAVVSLESVLEESFVSLLAGSVTYSRAHIVPKIHQLSRATATELILSGKSYADWLPIEQTEKRAFIFFKDGQPFLRLTSAHKHALSQIMAIRNAIAHPSENARLKFQKSVLSGLPIRPVERTPAGYLRSVFRSSPKQTRYENLIEQCLDVARTICK